MKGQVVQTNSISLETSALFPKCAKFIKAVHQKQVDANQNQQSKCSTCTRCLQELFRQGCYLMFGDLKNKSDLKFDKLPNNFNEGRLLEKLCLPDHPQIGTDGFCRVCDTRVIQLKIEAARAIRNLRQQSHLSNLQTSYWQVLINRQLQCQSFLTSENCSSPISPNQFRLFDRSHPNFVYPPRQFINYNNTSILKPDDFGLNLNAGKYHIVDYSKPFNWAVKHNLASVEQVQMLNTNQPSNKSTPTVPTTVKSDVSDFSSAQNLDSNSNMAAAASFFARAGKKPNANDSLSAVKKKKKLDSSKSKDMELLTNFSECLKATPPPVPPGLLKTSASRPLGHSAGKIKVIVRLKYLDTSKSENISNGSPSQSFVIVDSSKKQITTLEPSATTSTPRRTNNVPKMFGFDAIYTDDDDTTELCSNALTDIIQAVVSGTDGCVFSFGHLRSGSYPTMIGSDQQMRKFGLIPCAISWLFRLICEQKEKTGARFSVRVSAIEVCGKQEILKDLLSDIEGADNIGHCSPGVYLRDDPVSGTQLQNQNELRAPTAEKAAYYLDAALASRTTCSSEEEARISHFLFTLHVYQYRVERGTSGSAVAGGRSRLHMLDFASGRIPANCESVTKESVTSQTDQLKPEASLNFTALSLSALATVLLALVNGQRHIPYRSSKLSQLLREAMSSLSTKTCMVAQIATNNSHYLESMQIIQFASKMQRLKRRKFSKLSGTSSDESSSCDSFGFRRASRYRSGSVGFSSESSNNGMTSSEADYTSSSEQSCDTVIYLGASRNRLGDDPSSFLLRKRRISAPGFHRTISEKSGSESDLSKLVLSKPHFGTGHNQKPSVRTNALAWPKVAAKNAIETLSTQKEMWVDGPNADFQAAFKSNSQTDNKENIGSFPKKEIETCKNEESHNVKINQYNPKNLAEFSNECTSVSHLSERERDNNKDVTIPTTSTNSTNSTSNENPSSQESITAAAGSAGSDNIQACLLNPSSASIDSSIVSGFNLPPVSLVESQSISTNFPLSAPHSYKPFVWDWVEKHSEMLVNVPIVNQTETQSFQIASTEEVKVQQKRTLKHCPKHQQQNKQQTSHTESSGNGNADRESRKRHKQSKQKDPSLTSKPQPHHVYPCLNPTIETHFSRVVEWVRSVSEETSRAHSSSPVRRNNNSREPQKSNKLTDDSPQNDFKQSEIIYRSLDRNAQNYFGNIQNQIPTSFNNSIEMSNVMTNYFPFSCQRQFIDQTNMPANFNYSFDEAALKFYQVCPGKFPNFSESTHHVNTAHPPNKSDIHGDDPNQIKSQSFTHRPTIHSSSKKNNKSSPTRQDRCSPSKGRSSLLLKNALFGRTKMSSTYNSNENNQYSVPNSPFRIVAHNNFAKQTTEFVPVSNTGGYHYVIMTSSLSTPAKNLKEEKLVKKRSSSTSPGKSSGSSSEKKRMNNHSGINKKEKGKEKSKESKHDNKAKTKKESKSKLSFLTSPLFGKRKEKEKALLNTTFNTKFNKYSKPQQTSQSCTVHQNMNESPSKVFSPYCTVTQPKHSAHSSSGHGSDCSSIYGHNNKYGDPGCHFKCRECNHIDEESACLTERHGIDQHQLLRRSQRRGGGHTSSGYESILRDSELSSQNDSTSESSLGVPPRAQTPEKQQSQSSSSSSKQSRSAPNKSEETSEDTQSPVSVRKMSPKPISKFHFKDQFQKENEIRKISRQIQFEKIYDLLAQQDMLKAELLQAKERLLVDPTSWSYDLHVVEQMDPDDPSFIEALEKETDILRRRVEACKSHVMLVTYFDCKYGPQIVQETKNQSVQTTLNRKLTPITR